MRACRPALAYLLLVPAGCASTSHVTAFQEAPIAAPRTIGLALDDGGRLPFGLPAERATAAAAKAGFAWDRSVPAYRLSLTAAVGPVGGSSYVPPADGGHRAWVARPDGEWRTRFGGRLLRITAVLVDVATNREVWRGSGTWRTRDPAADAPQLMDEILAKLPKVAV